MLDFLNNPWLISDTHFNHIKIKEYCNRPDNWQELLIYNWNSLIKKDDIVLHLGDFALGKRDNYRQIVETLNGKIYLLKGNHDRQKPKFYEDIGITLLEGDKLIFDKYIFTHRPIEVEKWDINVHGHIHNLDYGERHINICVEKLNYKPIKFFDLEK